MVLCIVWVAPRSTEGFEEEEEKEEGPSPDAKWRRSGELEKGGGENRR